MNLVPRASIYAQNCHINTNHLYDGQPYLIHLQRVVGYFYTYQHFIPEEAKDSVLAACWCHDVIEDCRQTYSDVMDALVNPMAVEIIYAVTNEKGRNREARANEKYYFGIRATPYATFVKLCDRLANVKYSRENKSKMFDTYKNEQFEFDHYLNLFNVYPEMWDELERLLK